MSEAIAKPDVYIAELYLALLGEGWMPPHMARARDYSDRSALKAADEDASKLNRESVKRALAAVDPQR